MINLSANQPLRYAVLGTGAVGGFYGARLQQAGREVHFLARSDYAQIRREGLEIKSKDGDFRLPQVHVYRDADQMPPCDVAIVALKAVHNDQLPRMLPGPVAGGGWVLVLQNGLGGDERAAALVGNERVLGGIPFVCANKIGPGLVEHIDYGFMTLGVYGEGYAPRSINAGAVRVAEDFRAAGIPVELAEDLLAARWRKLVWNVPFNGLSVILNASTDAMISDPDIRILARALMEEVRTGSAACGREMPESYLDAMIRHTEQMLPYRTSMKIDCEEARPMEVEAIYGNPLRMAQAQGVDLPRLGTLYRQLKFLNERLSAGRPHPPEQ